MNNEVTGKKADGKKVCPTCHQVINSRVLKLRKAHVSALIKSVEYMAKHKTNHFSIADFEEWLTKTEYANFNEIKRMLPAMVSGKPGEYVFNTPEVMAFLQGGTVVTEFLVTAGHKELQPLTFGTVANIKGSKAFIQDHKWITEYRRPELVLSQLNLV